MKKNSLLVILILFCSATIASAEIVEAIVARVGDRIITRTEFQKRLDREVAEIEANAPADRAEAIKERRRKELLDEMISELLVRDRAEQIGIAVTDQEVAQAVNQLKNQYGITTDEEFEASLRQAGMTPAQMETRLRETLLSNKLFARELRSRSQLGDKELRKRYEREKERYRLPERAEVREIIVLIPENANEQQIEQLEDRAKQAYERATGGGEFEALVSEYSEAPSKAEAGSIGTVSRGELLPALDSGVFASDAGAIVGPIRTRFGFHILSVDNRLPSEVPSFDEIKERLREEESEAAFQRDLKAYLENLRTQSFVVVHEEM
ncbi:MAG: SurA N-terminal domain-containing protein, partial [Acidobacteria bacterium]|nr:SurA N-terminal domain-containing protein [Acidobacteriota bacterium]